MSNFQRGDEERNADLHLQLSEKYMAYKDYADRVMITPEGLCKWTSTICRTYLLSLFQFYQPRKIGGFSTWSPAVRFWRSHGFKINSETSSCDRLVKRRIQNHWLSWPMTCTRRSSRWRRTTAIPPWSRTSSATSSDADNTNCSINGTNCSSDGHITAWHLTK